MRKFTNGGWAAILFFSTFMLPLAASADDAWNFSIEPYLLAANIEGDASVGRAVGAEVDVDTGDILENLKMAMMIHGEAHHPEGWGIIFDYGFMKLGADGVSSTGGVIDAEVRQGTLELLGARRFDLAKSYYEIYGGIRWWDNDIDLFINPAILPGSATASINQDWVDPVIGIRFTTSLSRDWELVLRGDIGGFGVSSDFSGLLAAGAHYRFRELISLDIQYKALWVDYEDGNRGTPGYFAYDTVTHGPVIGVIFEY